MKLFVKIENTNFSQKAQYFVVLCFYNEDDNKNKMQSKAKIKQKYRKLLKERPFQAFHTRNSFLVFLYHEIK